MNGIAVCAFVSCIAASLNHSEIPEMGHCVALEFAGSSSLSLAVIPSGAEPSVGQS